MERLPWNIILNIFSKVPVKCLARSRCVSKVWCNYINDRYLTIIHDKRVVEEPTPILCHEHEQKHTNHKLQRVRTASLCFHVIESIQTTTSHDYVLKPKESPSLGFLRMKPLSKSSEVRIEVQGSCNGVVCLSQEEDFEVTLLVAIHPLRKEIYELPPLPFELCLMGRESCGLGFDDSLNTLKMVCVVCREFVPPGKDNIDLVRKNLCTMVHDFGTNSWREIPQVPSYPVSGQAIYSNSCLHWLVSPLDSQIKDGSREIIWFNVKKEEFGLINPPKRMCDQWGCDRLVDLNCEVGYVSYNSTMEVWVLKHNEWLPHCRFEQQITPNGGDIYVLGCWNKDGDILIKITCGGGGKDYEFFVYNLKSGVFHKTNIVGNDGPYDGFSPNIIMHPSSLISIHGIHSNSFPMKKTDFKKSCKDLLSGYN